MFADWVVRKASAYTHRYPSHSTHNVPSPLIWWMRPTARPPPTITPDDPLCRRFRHATASRVKEPVGAHCAPVRFTSYHISGRLRSHPPSHGCSSDRPCALAGPAPAPTKVRTNTPPRSVAHPLCSAPPAPPATALPFSSLRLLSPGLKAQRGAPTKPLAPALIFHYCAALAVCVEGRAWLPFHAILAPSPRLSLRNGTRRVHGAHCEAFVMFPRNRRHRLWPRNSTRANIHATADGGRRGYVWACAIHQTSTLRHDHTTHLPGYRRVPAQHTRATCGPQRDNPHSSLPTTVGAFAAGAAHPRHQPRCDAVRGLVHPTPRAGRFSSA